MSSFSLGTCELSSNAKNNLWRSFLAEFIGTFILNFFSCAACSQAKGDVVLISLAFGLSLFVSISCLGHVSGCHINPAVTFSFLAIGKISVIRFLFYIVAQFSGATTAIVALKNLIQNVPGTDTLCHTVLHNDITPLQGFVIEFSMGFLLLFVICGVTEENKPESRFVAPLVIGCTVILAHLAFVSFTSASMSPSATFATAIVFGLWDNNWVYFCAPTLGGICGSIIYTQIFSAMKPEEMERYAQVQRSEAIELETK